jgi:hypothetical protein
MQLTASGKGLDREQTSVKPCAKSLEDEEEWLISRR